MTIDDRTSRWSWRRVELARWLACWMLVSSCVAATTANEPKQADLEFFEQKIRPVLVKHCYACHSADAEKAKKLRGGLRVDSREALRQGGESGAAVVPGKVDESLLVAALRHDGLEMPPDGKLPEAVVADFVKWVETGAADPRDGAASSASRGIDFEAGRQFWSYQPVVKPTIPEVKNAEWARSPIDRFVLAKLEAAKLTPAPEAERRVLVRRAYFDLWGLPPSPEDIDAFVADDSPDAFGRLVDRLLASPRFGERWGRHWLDVARFAETTGGGRSMFFGSAWRYRDYVVAAFNADKPYDQFIVEQIAGDQLPFDDYRQGQEQIVATAFLALGPHNYEEQDKNQLRMDVVDEQIDTTCRAFLGMSLGCARCHDHKFDPIPTTDYYALAGIFRSTQSLVTDNVSTWVKRTLPLDDAAREAVARHERAVRELQSRIDAHKATLARWQGAFPEITLDDDAARLVGEWTPSDSIKPFVGRGYRYAHRDAQAAFDFADRVEPGEYLVRVAYTPHPKRARDARVVVTHADGTAEARLDQTQTPPIDGKYTDVGVYRFSDQAKALVTVESGGAADVVVADAVQLVPRFRPKHATPRKIVAEAAALPGIVVDDTGAELMGDWKPTTAEASYVGQGYLEAEGAATPDKSVSFRADLPRSGDYEVRLAYAATKQRSANVSVQITHDVATKTLDLDQRKPPDVDGLFARLGRFRFVNDQTAIVTVANRGAGTIVADAVQFLPVEELRDMDTPVDSASETVAAELASLGPADAQAKIATVEAELRQLRSKLKKLADRAPPAAPEVMSIQDEPDQGDCRVCIRGDVKNLGPTVPRGFLSVITGNEKASIADGASGRLELARWIARADNPLTARVMVNRLWRHLFGAGLVRTVDNFGTVGEPPSHPELLEYLASRFVEQNWSVKSMIREIMLSRTYQQSSLRSTDAKAADPENRLLAGQNRRRLEAEAIYDSILSLGGKLDLTLGGDTVRAKTKSEFGYDFDVGRRAVYLPVFRNRLPDLFAVFDFPDPNLSLGDRTTSTLSTQALFLMNSPLVMDQARHAAERLLSEPELDDARRIERLYLRALGRAPTDAERQIAARFVSARPSGQDDERGRLARWSGLCQAVVASIDFRYVD